MKVVVVCLAICSIVSFNIFAQAPRGSFDPANMPKESVISGKVLDHSSSAPIEYATIGVFSMRDSSLVTGGITGPDGLFTIDKLPYGRFYLDISFVGFKKFRVNNVALNPNKKAVNIGEVKLETASTALNEVEVVGNRNQVEYKIDKKVVNVSSNIIAAGGTAVDALENTPSVQVDIEGNVSLRGSSSFTVLIDGRPSVLEGSDALQQIPASAIQNIEIITNPSAKYNPEGSSGIINVVMKKQKQIGINGVVNSSVSTNGGYSGDFLVNIRKSKLNYYIGANYNKMRNKNTGVSNKEIYGIDTTTFEDINSGGYFNRKGYGVKGGVDFFMDAKNTFSLSGSYREFQMGNESDNQTRYYKNAGNTLFFDQYTIGSSNFTRKHPHKEGNLNYIHKFNDNGHQLEVLLNYSEGPGTEESFRSIDTTNMNWVPDITKNTFQERTVEGGYENEFTTKVDYAIPFNDRSKFEAGYQGDYEYSKEKYKIENYNNTSKNWIEDYSRANNREFKDHVQSLYSTFSSSLVNVVDYQVGVRLEHSNRILEQKISGTENVFNKLDWFPTIHLSRKLPGELQVQTSYTRRIRRPREMQLDPTEIRMNERNIRIGNPDLKPSYTNSYEFNVQKSFNGKGFISGELFHRNTTGLIENFTQIKDTITYSTYRNLSADYSTGFEGMINMPLTKWWTLNTSVSLYNYKIDSGSDDAYAANDNSTFTWNARINSMFRLKWGTSIQLMGFYNAASITSQGTRDAMFFTNIGVRQDLMNRKLTLSVQVRDLFGANKFESTTQGPNFKNFSSMKRQSQIVTFSISFKINNYKADRKERGNRDDSNEMDFEGGGGEGMM
ncbi:MAG TPA: TonB-dependent receptor [Bacteroidales bacterium]|nr:TonB-dependent receptor [Bacteroidales bacterium]